MRIVLLEGDRLRLEAGPGELGIEAAAPDRVYGPFDMLASGLVTCIYSVLHAWAESSGLEAADLAIEIGWEFADRPRRVGSFDIALIWPSLPESRRRVAERAAHLCPVHKTLQHAPRVHMHVEEGTPNIGP